jgi:hypothetical protein
MRDKGTRSRIASVAVITAALVGTVAITSAMGGGGFLTKKKANNLFEKKGTSYSKAESDGRYYGKGESDGRFRALADSTRYAVSSANWVTRDPVGNPLDLSNTGTVGLNSTGAEANVFFDAALTLPQAIQGRNVSVDSFELCYTAISATATLDAVFLHRRTQTAADPYGGTLAVSPIFDDTDRDDESCRTYSGAGPVELGPNDVASIAIRADFSGAGGIGVSRLTVNTSS